MRPIAQPCEGPGSDAYQRTVPLMTDMHDGRQEGTEIDRLPREPVHRLTEPLTRFPRIEAAGGAVLLSCTALALVLSNSPWGPAILEAWETSLGVRLGSLEFDRSLRAWINDALMTFFFLLVAVELKRELVLGELGWGLLAGGGLLAGIGFTMALFIADLAFDDSLLHSAKLGVIVASAVSAVAGLAVLTWIAARGRSRPPAPT